MSILDWESKVVYWDIWGSPEPTMNNFRLL